MEIILETMKKMLTGIDMDYDAFDTDLIVHINTFLGVLNELGVGVDGFRLTEDNMYDATFDDFLASNSVPLEEVKTYLYLRVRQVFDPPTSSILSQVFDKQIEELGWRMTTKIECTLEE